MTKEPGHIWTLVQSWLDSTWNPPSQNKLAARLGVSSSALGDYKYARHMPQPEFLRNLAEILMVPYEAVLDAALKDHGYRPADHRGVEEHADRSATNKVPETGPGQQPVLRQIRENEVDVAARPDRRTKRRPRPDD